MVVDRRFNRVGAVLGQELNGFITMRGQHMDRACRCGFPKGQQIVQRVCRILCKRTIHRRRKPACP